MPRKARIDAPGALHHIICRGLTVNRPSLTTRTATQIAVTAITFFLVSPAISRADTLEPLYGNWKVFAAHLDETLTRTPNYNYNDRRLLGRSIKISESEIRSNLPEETYCFRPNATRAMTNIDNLIDTTMGNAEVLTGPGHKRYGLQQKNDLKVWWVACEKGDIGPDTPFGPEGRNWLALLSKDEMAMRWYDNVILLLRRQTGLGGP